MPRISRSRIRGRGSASRSSASRRAISGIWWSGCRRRGSIMLPLGYEPAREAIRRPCAGRPFGGRDRGTLHCRAGGVLGAAGPERGPAARRAASAGPVPRRRRPTALGMPGHGGLHRGPRARDSLPPRPAIPSLRTAPGPPRRAGANRRGRPPNRGPILESRIPPADYQDTAEVSHPLDRRPVIVAIAGPNGAGKTTFYRSHLQAAGLRFLNADVWARQLNIDAYAAARAAGAMRDELVRQRES